MIDCQNNNNRRFKQPILNSENIALFIECRIKARNGPTFNFIYSDVKSYGKQKFFQCAQNAFL